MDFEKQYMDLLRSFLKTGNDEYLLKLSQLVADHCIEMEIAPDVITERHYEVVRECVNDSSSGNGRKVFFRSGEALLEVMSRYSSIFFEYLIKIQEEQKVDKLKSIGVLAGGIAHDFNNLLTAILGNIQLAKMYSTEREVIERLEESEKASLQARDLTRQLLSFSKGGAPVRETADISELLKDTAQFALRGSNVRCKFSIPDGLWMVEIDKGQISQVIQNLVINADQAMPGGGELKIEAENVVISDKDELPLKQGKYIRISVEDEGIGIPKKYIQKVFDPYFTTKGMSSQKGAGLGLALCYSIIEKHGGYIVVESEVEVGTTFYVYLPVSQEPISTEEEVEEQSLVGEGKILIMDDEEGVRDVVRSIFKHIGYEVEVTEDGSSAIKVYQEAKESGKPFDAIILDLTVPGGMGGIEAIEKLLEIDSEVKAIVSSGYSNDPIMSDYKQYGFSGAVAKPYQIKELSNTLRKVVYEEVEN